MSEGGSSDTGNDPAPCGLFPMFILLVGFHFCTRESLARGAKAQALTVRVSRRLSIPVRCVVFPPFFPHAIDRFDPKLVE